jgi:hypothetical protein
MGSRKREEGRKETNGTRLRVEVVRSDDGDGEGAESGGGAEGGGDLKGSLDREVDEGVGGRAEEWQKVRV